jgi:uncharacterized protein with von Willebrand factor type A (vWA) domain
MYELRGRGVPVGTQEVIALAQALQAGLHESSLDGFYNVARSVMIHSEAHLDSFDEAFLSFFKGVEIESKKLKDELWDWLQQAKEDMGELTDEQREFVENLDLDELRKLFEERLAEQDEQHDGGNKWIGTGGTSPFGHSGRAPKGFRIGGSGGGRSAVKVADARLYRPYRQDLTLDVRQMQVALRKLRLFSREGGEEELDLEGTIDATAQNAGELEVITRPPRRHNTRIILMMDVGGSMDPFAHLCSRLFSAAKKSSHFKELRTYYFHNCVYGHVYETERFDTPIKVRDLIHETGPHYKLIMVGDALTRPRRRPGHRRPAVAHDAQPALPPQHLAQSGAAAVLERQHDRVRASDVRHVSPDARGPRRGRQPPAQRRQRPLTAPEFRLRE